jgi:hypothetical protein
MYNVNNVSPTGKKHFAVDTITTIMKALQAFKELLNIASKACRAFIIIVKFKSKTLSFPVGESLFGPVYFDFLKSFLHVSTTKDNMWKSP